MRSGRRLRIVDGGGRRGEDRRQETGDQNAETGEVEFGGAAVDGGRKLG